MHTQRDFSTFSMMVLWFGASISIAEVITGTMLAPLGLQQGFLAILCGHVIGGAILLLAGLTGAQSGLSSTGTFRISFGRFGSYAFSVLNMLQLLGWTTVMIISGAKALNGISSVLGIYQNEKLWCVLIGALIFIWISRGMKAIFKVHTLVVVALFLCFLVLGYLVFSKGDTIEASGSGTPINFGDGVEFGVAMCLSWLPLISDYSRTLIHPVRGTVAGVLCYTFGGVLMFTIGLGAAIYTGTSEISTMLITAGMGVTGLFIVAFSTVTNTFLDAFSAGVSAKNINARVNEKQVGIAVVFLATVLALLVPMSQYVNFLYLIGSVFAPLFAILLVEFFIFGRRGIQDKINIKNLALWLLGFCLYRALMPYNSVLGITFPVMLSVGALTFVLNKVLAILNK